MWTKQLKIEGMTCPSCADGIEKKLNALEGVEIKVSHPKSIGFLSVKGDTSLKLLINQIEDNGIKQPNWISKKWLKTLINAVTNGQPLHVAVINL